MLNVNTLKTLFIDMFEKINDGRIHVSYPSIPPPPSISLEVCEAITDVYNNWILSSNVIAGALSLAVNGSTSAMKPLLIAPSFSGLGLGFSAYWSTAMFSNVGFLPLNPINPASLISGTALITAEISSMILSDSSYSTIDSTALKLSTILMNATSQLQVLATTTTTPPVVSLFPLT